MNLLKLPPYRSREALRDKLLYAIDAGAGFDLS
jgi:ubiquitin-protein ligase E3 C